MAVIHRYIFNNNFIDEQGDTNLVESGVVGLALTNPKGIASPYTASGFSNVNELDLNPASLVAALNASGEGTVEVGFILDNNVAANRALWASAEAADTSRRYDVFMSSTAVQVLLPAATTGSFNSGVKPFTFVRGTYYTILFNWDGTNYSIIVFNHLTRKHTAVVNNGTHGITPGFTDFDIASVGQVPWAAGNFFQDNIFHVALHDSRENLITVVEAFRAKTMIMFGSSHVPGNTFTTDGMRPPMRLIADADGQFALNFAGPTTTGVTDFTPKHSGGANPTGEIALCVSRVKANVESEIGEDESANLWLVCGPQGTHDTLAGTLEAAYKTGIDDFITQRDAEAPNSPVFFVTAPNSISFDNTDVNTWMKEEFDVLVGLGNQNIFFIDLASQNPEIGADNVHMTQAGTDVAGTYIAEQILLALSNPAAFDSHGRRGRR